MKRSFKLMGLITLTSTTVLAGSLDPPSAPGNSSSGMYSIQSLCDRLQTGAAGSQSVFTEPTSGPGATGCTLNDVMNYAPVLDNINGATPAEVIAGKTFWGLRNGNWGVLTGTYNSGSACVGTATLGDVLAGQTFSGTAGLGLTGTMPNNGTVTLTPSTTTQAIAAGYHNGSGTVIGDADLVTGNLKNGVTLFGVSGKAEVVDTTEAASPATATTLLSGKKAFVNGVAVTGTVPASANVTGAAGNLVMTIPNGLYLGSETATANDADLIAGNIKNGIDLFGIVGSYNPLIATGNATAGQVLNGQTFSNSISAGITGTMPNIGAITLTPSTTTQTIAAGYHNGSGTVIGDADLVTGNLKNGVTLFGVSGKAEVVDTTEAASPATATTLLSGKKAFVNGGAITGTVPAGANVTGAAGNLVMTIPNGLYLGSETATANDADLVATNIRSGVNLFGVSGDSNVVNTSTGDATAADLASGKKAWVDGSEITGTAYNAAVPKTGQTTSYATGDDGDLEKGVTLPSPRFTNNGNGTVTDNLTGLIWLRNANCFGTKTWTNALSSANTLANGTCGLTDGSTAGQWRLPNENELHSLVHHGYFNPALSNAAGTAKWTTGDPFSNVLSSYYWSASSYAGGTSDAWVVFLFDGNVYTGGKTATRYVWPVRGGQ